MTKKELITFVENGIGDESKEGMVLEIVDILRKNGAYVYRNDSGVPCGISVDACNAAISILLIDQEVMR